MWAALIDYERGAAALYIHNLWRHILYPQLAADDLALENSGNEDRIGEQVFF